MGTRLASTEQHTALNIPPHQCLFRFGLLICYLCIPQSIRCSLLLALGLAFLCTVGQLTQFPTDQYVNIMNRLLSFRGISSSVAAKSNIGKAPLKYPQTVTIHADQGLITVVGERGKLQMPQAAFINLEFTELDSRRAVLVKVADPKDKKQRAMWGTTRALMANMVTGVTDGFTVPIRIVGVGYRALIEENKVSLKLGFSHPILLDIPNGVEVQIPAPQRIILQGNDLEAVTQFAAKIRHWRKPEPYNQKGIFVGDETIKKKEGKKR